MNKDSKLLGIKAVKAVKSGFRTLGISFTNEQHKCLEKFIFKANQKLKPGEYITRGAFTRAVILREIGYKNGK